MENSLNKEYWINAPVEKVYACFTEEEAMLAWHGKEITLDPRPGGIYKVVFEDGTTILGEYKEVLPNKRVVYSARYGTVDSLITIDFAPENGGTTIYLKQVFEPGQDTSPYSGGWDYFVGLLQEMLEG